MLTPKVGYTTEYKATVIKAYAERSSLRGLARTFKHSRTTITKWIKANLSNLPLIEETLQPADKIMMFLS